MNKSVAFYTLGCKLNYSETSTISEEFLNNGYLKREFNDRADVYVINTCTVTENAEKDCRKIVRKALISNPNAYVIVTGCYAQLRAEEISKIEGVDAVLGSNEKFKIFDLIKVLSGNRDIFLIVGQTEGIAAEFCIYALNLCAVHNGCPVTTNEAGIWF